MAPSIWRSWCPRRILTFAAFKGQLQAAWRACLEALPGAIGGAARRWAVLPKFLQELAAQAGEDGALETFVEILGAGRAPARCDVRRQRPGDVTADALSPYAMGRRRPQGDHASGLGTVSVNILCPFVGSWSADALGRWCKRVDGSPDRLGSDLDRQGSSVGCAEKWLLSEATSRALNEVVPTCSTFAITPTARSRRVGFTKNITRPTTGGVTRKSICSGGARCAECS